jgi:hypothetical protein
MGKGAPAGLSKDEEIARLGEELQAHELMVNEEVKARERLERENLTKIKEIRLLEQRIASNHAAQLAEIDLIETEAQTEKTRAQHDIEIMQHKLVTTTQHLEAYDEMEHENAVLRARAGACLEQLQEEGLSHAAAEHKMKKEMFNLRMQLEQTFRKTLQEKDAQYRERAFEAMSEESRMALVANAKLQEELSLQSVGVEHFMQRFKTTTEEHRKLQQQHALLSEASKLQLNTASKLKRQKLEQEALVADLQSSMRKMERSLARTVEARHGRAGAHGGGARGAAAARLDFHGRAEYRGRCLPAGAKLHAGRGLHGRKQRSWGAIPPCGCGRGWRLPSGRSGWHEHGRYPRNLEQQAHGGHGWRADDSWQQRQRR